MSHRKPSQDGTAHYIVQEEEVVGSVGLLSLDHSIDSFGGRRRSSDTGASTLGDQET